MKAGAGPPGTGGGFPWWLRILAATALGTLAGPAALTAAYAIHPAVSLDMDRDAPVLRGTYPPERAGDDTFVWTGSAATLDLPGLDRHRSWACVIRLRGPRPDPLAPPDVRVMVDGETRTTLRAGNEYADVQVAIPARAARAGAVVAVNVSNTFRPGPDDPRDLGVMLDRWRCAPQAAGLVIPPRRARTASAVSAGALGLMWALLGLAEWPLVLAVLAPAAALALPLGWNTGPFVSSYLARVTQLALLSAGAAAAWRGLLAWRHAVPHAAARFVAGFTAAAAVVRLAALLHPAKDLVDALFHAHRLEWVLSGRYYFTQPLPNGVTFPYAIGLYVFAAPWARLVADHVLLLRVVVCASDAVACALLYLLVVRVWGDRLAGALGVVLASLVPLFYWIVGNGNLTNAFGQSAGLVAAAGAVLLPVTRRRWLPSAALALLTALALLSHVSTFALLLATLAAFAGLEWWLAPDAVARRHALIVIQAVAIAAVLAIAVYYGHFGDVYARLGALRAGSGGSTAGTPSVARRGVDAIGLSAAAIGWPIVLAALAGAWSLWRAGTRDRMTWLVGGWLVAFAMFLAVGVLAPVSGPFQRYAAEFVGRVVGGTYPAFVVLAARAGATAWRDGGVRRALAVAGAGWAVAAGGGAWMAWLF